MQKSQVKIKKILLPKPKLKNKVTNESISIRINTIWLLCIKQIKNLKIAEYFLKKWEFILAIKSQRYLSTLCPTTKLHLSGIFLKTVLNKSHSSILAIFIIATLKLFEVTYGKGNHLKSAMCLSSPWVPQAGWYEYDGLWKHYQRGSGLRYCGIAKNACYFLFLLPVVCPLFASVPAKKI